MHAQVRPTVPFGAAKNTCYLCEGAPRSRGEGNERMIDTAVHIEFEGFIAICETCVTHMGKLLGLLAPEDVEGLTAELQDALESLAAAERKVADLTVLEQSYRNILGLDPEGEEVHDAEVVEPDDVELPFAAEAILESAPDELARQIVEGRV